MLPCFAPSPSTLTVVDCPYLTSILAGRATIIHRRLESGSTHGQHKWATYSPEKGTPRSWLLAIALDQSRRAASRHTRTYLLSDGPSTDHPAAAVDLDRDIDLRAAVRRLPDRQRKAAVLFYYVDLPVNEIAALMGCSAGRVKSTLSDAGRRLANLLKEKI